MIKKLLNNKFIKFAIVGGICTLIDLVIFYYLYNNFSKNIYIVNTISYGIGLTIGFFINRIWTFKKNISYKKIKLVLIYGYIGLVLNSIIVDLASDYIHVMLAKIVAVIIILIYNFSTNKFLIFKDK